MYQYPIDLDWTTKEIIDVIHFYGKIEEAYEKGVPRDQLMAAYRRFKEIVPSKAEENRLGREFEEVSGYSLYKVMKKGKEGKEGDIIKLP